MKLADAGLETVLVFEDGIDLPQFAAFPLVDSDEGRATLKRYYTPFLELARDRGVPLVLSVPTWRANPDWGTLLGYDGEALAAANRRAVAFMEELHNEFAGAEVVIDGCIGPRSDAYAPTLVMDAGDAHACHAFQIETLASAGCEQVTALTLTYSDEAIGIVRAAKAAGIPVVVGFTVETDGRLPSGESLADAIATVDDATDGGGARLHDQLRAPDALRGGSARGRVAYSDHRSSRECVHPQPCRARRGGGAPVGDPDDLAARYVAWRGDLPGLEVLGGCCGTDIRHVTAIADAWLGAA